MTASNIGKDLQRKSNSKKSFKQHFKFKNDVSSLNYGKNNEKDAKKMYFKDFVSIYACGLVVNKELPFICPDNKVCDNGHRGLQEIKCSYSARNMTTTEAFANISDF